MAGVAVVMVILIDPGVLAGLLPWCLGRLAAVVPIIANRQSWPTEPAERQVARRSPSIRRWRLRFLQLSPPAASTPIATTRLCGGRGLCRQLPSNAQKRSGVLRIVLAIIYQASIARSTIDCSTPHVACYHTHGKVTHTNRCLARAIPTVHRCHRLHIQPQPARIAHAVP
jgi:hypothetical protein